jgi:RNA polymerase subunit RPABC4/transcription elongation factor Spt4
MKKKECPSCAMEVDARSKACPICGYEFAETSSSTRVIAILLLVVFVLSMFYFLL